MYLKLQLKRRDQNRRVIARGDPPPQISEHTTVPSTCRTPFIYALGPLLRFQTPLILDNRLYVRYALIFAWLCLKFSLPSPSIPLEPLFLPDDQLLMSFFFTGYKQATATTPHPFPS